MKPILVIPPETIDAEGVKELRDNGVCVVVALDPAKVKFLDSIPCAMARTNAEQAAIELSRKVLDPREYTHTLSNGDQAIAKRDVWKFFMEAVVSGTTLDPNGTREEQEQSIIDEARRAELRAIGREEARAEAARKKAESAAKSSGKKAS